MYMHIDLFRLKIKKNKTLKYQLLLVNYARGILTDGFHFQTYYMNTSTYIAFKYT